MLKVQAFGLKMDTRLAYMPTMTMTSRMVHLDRMIELALEPVTRDVKTARVFDDNLGRYVDRERPIVDRNFKAAIEYEKMKQKLMESDEWRALMRVAQGEDTESAATLTLQSMHQARARLTRGQAGAQSGGGDGPELGEIDPAIVDELNAESGQPFRSPDILATTETREQHAERMRRWEEEGIAPPGAPSRPTRKVNDDGTVEILDGDKRGLVVKPHDTKVEEPDYGEALLSKDGKK
jgi:hypothetical protein